MSGENRDKHIEQLLEQLSDAQLYSLPELLERLPGLIEFAKSLSMLNHPEYPERLKSNDSPSSVSAIIETLHRQTTQISNCQEYLNPSYQKHNR